MLQHIYLTCVSKPSKLAQLMGANEMWIEQSVSQFYGDTGRVELGNACCASHRTVLPLRQFSTHHVREFRSHISFLFYVDFSGSFDTCGEIYISHGFKRQERLVYRHLLVRMVGEVYYLAGTPPALPFENDNFPSFSGKIVGHVSLPRGTSWTTGIHGRSHVPLEQFGESDSGPA